MGDRGRLHNLIDQLPDGELYPAIRFIQFLLSSNHAKPPTHEFNASEVEKGPGGDFCDCFKKAVKSYCERPAENRYQDPFIRWFRREFSSSSAPACVRILAILVDARFNQGARAERALENTKRIWEAGVLTADRVELQDVPTLHGTRFCPPDEWRAYFWAALPKLRELANSISSHPKWSGARLLSMIRRSRIPYFGPKTRRLAVRWLRDLVTDLTVDMADSQVPVDRLLYRVAARLDIVDPSTDKYTGPGSRGDRTIQGFAKKLFPENPTLIDEPLWMTGRHYCRPSFPRCNEGCIFVSCCPKHHRESDPAAIGYMPCQPAEGSHGKLPAPRSAPTSPNNAESAKGTGTLVVVACVGKKIWDVDKLAPPCVPAGDAFCTPLFDKTRAYARKFGQRWCVFSARYGLMLPWEEIKNYNATFKLHSPCLVDPETLKTQITEKGLDAFSQVVVLGGKEHVERARQAFLHHGIHISDPLSGMKIGERLHWLDQALIGSSASGVT